MRHSGAREPPRGGGSGGDSLPPQVLIGQGTVGAVVLPKLGLVGHEENSMEGNKCP